MRRWVRNQRGSALLFTTAMLLFLLWMGGIAIDLAYVSSARGELQRSLDAAALAGAGKLAFDNTVFDTSRTWAHNFALLNRMRNGTDNNVTLDLNTGNTATGNIVLGTWNAGSFAPWSSGSDPNGFTVNAVRCQWNTTVPTTFLRLLGINSLNVAAIATAISNPPVTVPCGLPVLPLGVTQCSFQDAGTGAFSSQGCGTGLTFIDSSTICNNQPGSPQACNTAAWASLDGSQPSASYLKSTIQQAGSQSGTCASFLSTGQNTTANNGMADSVFTALRDAFLTNRTATLTTDVCPAGYPALDGGGCTGGVAPVYPRSSGGWPVAVMVMQTSCPPGPMSGSHQVLTYASFVMTQIYYKNDGCEVKPNPDPQAASYCSSGSSSLRAIFGYFQCGDLGLVAAETSVPRVAIADHMRLVQ